MSIFQNGVWSCSFDFLADGTIPSGNVFDVGSTGSGAPSVGATAARFSGKGITIPSSAGFIGRSLSTNLASVITGFSFKTTALPTSGVVTIATLYDATAGQPQATLGYNSTGKMGFYSVGGVQENNVAISGQIGALSAAGTVIPNSYDFWEIAGTINNVSGALTLKKNGVSVLTFSGDTQVTANAYVNRIYFGQSNPGAATIATHYIDDIYILDLTGAAPLNTFLGPGRLQTDGPIGDSSTAGLNTWAFTTPQGTDYGNAASVPPSVSNYNSSATIGQRMSFRFPGLSVAQVLFLNTWINAEEDAAGTRIITPIYRSNNIDQNGSAIGLGTNYTYYSQNSATDPNTNQLWANELPSVAAACEIGVQVTG